MAAGVGGVTHPEILATWSEHLWNCGFAHRDYLAALADENGMIHVSQLPEQIVRLQAAVRGPRSTWNPAARWVSAETPDPEPIRLPDIRQLTLQENEAMIAQYREAGMLDSDDSDPGWVMAQEVSE
jgi:hypothetical protein